MKQIISDIYQDHQRISALLCILKNKLVTLEAGARPNFILMSELLDYLDDYADRFHHPREDLVFSYLRELHQKAAGLVDQASKEHRELAELTLDLRESVEQVLLDEPFSIQDFARRLRRFIDKQGGHLAFEEGKLLPLMEQLMTASDWLQLAEQMPEFGDPLINVRREEHYQQLYNALIEDLS